MQLYNTENNLNQPQNIICANNKKKTIYEKKSNTILNVFMHMYVHDNVKSQFSYNDK